METPEPKESLSLRELLQSALAGALGVQSGKNRQRDFSRGKAHQFIFLGIGFTALLTISLLLLVKLILHLAGV